MAIHLKLQGRFTLGNTIMMVIAVMTLSAVQLFFFSRNSQQVLEQTTAQITHSLMAQQYQRAAYTAELLTDSLIDPVYMLDMEGIYQVLDPVLQNEEVAELRVFDPDGRIIHSGDKLMPEYGSQLRQSSVLRHVLEQQKSFSYFGDQGLVFASPLLLNGELLGGIYLRLSQTRINQDIERTGSLISGINQQSQQQFTLSIVITAAILSLLSILLSLLVGRTLIRPILGLVSHTRRIAGGEYQPRQLEPRHDEIGELVDAFNDMSHCLRERTDRISFLAYHDPLTQLPNRISFIHHVDQLIKASQQHSELSGRRDHLEPAGQPAQFAVIFIDLDEFKGVNDNFGHQAGDRLLCEVARRIGENLRSDDYLAGAEAVVPDSQQQVVARIGGDEFLLCVPAITGPRDASRIAARLLDVLSQPVSVGEDEVIVDGSIGIALYPEAGTSADELIKHADIAMYAAKADGKHTYCHFTGQMKQRIEHRALIERELRKALEELEQFELWYQPQYDLLSGRLIGAEALLRWRHPQRGVIPPDDFIPIAEATGMILPIGEWILESACRQLSLWREHLPAPFHVAINLSAKQLYRQRVAVIARQKLQRYQLSPAQLHIEVTESLLMKDEKQAKKALDDMRRSGIKVWLDDFGTGYSSLGYLRKFQVDGVKIDRCFVNDIADNDHDRALCAAIISMAGDLGMAVIAEGIESRQQEQFLAGKACNIGQGYYYSRPLPAAGFAAAFLDIRSADETTAANSDRLQQ